MTLPRSATAASLLFALVGVLAAGCSDSFDPGPAEERFGVTLNGVNVVPGPVETPATGEAILSARGGSEVNFTITVNQIEGVTAAHLHGPAAVHETGAVLVTLFEPVQPTGRLEGPNGALLRIGRFPSAEIPLDAGVTLDALLALMRQGVVYVDVHTTVQPDGELRGTVQPLVP
jgi:hypothetical protein